MSETVKIGIIGDFQAGLRLHEATNEGLKHAADHLSLSVESLWVPTPSLLSPDARKGLEPFDGLWAAPGSPESMEGALVAVRYARETGRPLFGN